EILSDVMEEDTQINIASLTNEILNKIK
ncbi:hydrolase, partial [Butyricicoccus sp. 1XD8-22]